MRGIRWLPVGAAMAVVALSAPARERRRSSRPRTAAAARRRASTRSPRRPRSTCWPPAATPSTRRSPPPSVLGVVEPYSCGIGGGGFMVIRDGETGEITTIDSREKSPGGDGAEQLLHRRQAADRRAVQRQPLQRPVAPACPARRTRGRTCCATTAPTSSRTRSPTASRSPATASRSTRPSSTRRRRTSRTSTTSRRPRRSTSTPTARRRTSARSLRNPDLAKTYERIGRLGVSKGFYPGPVADAIVKAATAPPTAPTADHTWRPGLLDQPRPRALPDEGARRRSSSTTSATTSTAWARRPPAPARSSRR